MDRRPTEKAEWWDAGDTGRLNSGSKWESGKSITIIVPGGESSISSSEKEADTSAGSGRIGHRSRGERCGVELLEREAVGMDTAPGVGVEPDRSPDVDGCIGCRDGVGAENGRSASEW